MMKKKISEEVYLGDNLIVLPEKIKTESIDLIVTSGPYDNAREYEGFPPLTLNRVRKLARESYRALTKRGVLCWNINDMSDGNNGESLNSFRHALILQKAGFHVKTIIWEKTIFNSPSEYGYYKMHEYVFLCHKGDFVFNPIMDVKVSGESQKLGMDSKRNKDGSFSTKEGRKEKINELPPKEFRKRGSVWTGNTAGQEYPCQKTWGHAPMPEWLVRDLIRSYSNEYDIVMDYFHGGGTTWKICRELARSYVGIEIGPSILDESKERISHVNPVMF